MSAITEYQRSSGGARGGERILGASGQVYLALLGADRDLAVEMLDDAGPRASWMESSLPCEAREKARCESTEIHTRFARDPTSHR